MLLLFKIAFIVFKFDGSGITPSVIKLLEQEKLEHEDLKRTWEMANEQFLESQNLLVMDIRRLESILNSEQVEAVFSEFRFIGVRMVLKAVLLCFYFYDKFVVIIQKVKYLSRYL